MRTQKLRNYTNHPLHHVPCQWRMQRRGVIFLSLIANYVCISFIKFALLRLFLYSSSLLSFWIAIPFLCILKSWPNHLFYFNRGPFSEQVGMCPQADNHILGSSGFAVASVSSWLMLWVPNYQPKQICIVTSRCLSSDGMRCLWNFSQIRN